MWVVLMCVQIYEGAYTSVGLMNCVCALTCVCFYVTRSDHSYLMSEKFAHNAGVKYSLCHIPHSTIPVAMPATLANM